TFKPSNTIKFSEASKILVQAYNVSAGGASNVSANGNLWFKPYVTALEAKKDIPLSVEFFDETLQRADMAEMVYRLKANVTDKPTRTYNEVVGDNFVTVNSCVELKQRFDEQNAYNDAGLEGSYRTGMPMMEQPMSAPNATTAVPSAADSSSGKGGAMTSEG